ncbi:MULTISPECIES: hypothetical protein [unclassified Novosphingobium]|uniref:hypothetical protein n=1 Tax=unclassified Novosphingobium TaxID=2644732 RepID=UPI00146F5413|nr:MULTISPECIES: hypothetical protein [unclassified Novosphingobium]NMN06716.1 hypothetical protein [Novosphingobium sp. SG919]NMN88833.1 hypothetical protein [Novosphingobium sp. SG916]
MPKMTERERLAKIEADQESLAREAETVRRGLRAHYGKLVTELPVERLSEREFRDVLGQAIRVGGGAAIAALKGLSAQGVQAEPSSGSPRKRTTAAPAGADDASKTVHP